MKINSEVLNQLLVYNDNTGELFWKERSIEWFNPLKHSKEHVKNIWNARYAHQPAFNIPDSKGYFQGTLFTKTLRTHRVIWCLVHGDWPDKDIDHINGDRLDNRLTNLRSVSRATNSLNRSISSINTSGVLGVRKISPDGKWVAKIKHNGKSSHLGYFLNLECAIAARKQAEITYGFHENHGRKI